MSLLCDFDGVNNLNSGEFSSSPSLSLLVSMSILFNAVTGTVLFVICI